MLWNLFGLYAERLILINVTDFDEGFTQWVAKVQYGTLSAKQAVELLMGREATEEL